MISLRLHIQVDIKSIHEKSTTCFCGTCGGVFARKESLKAHIKAVHEGIKPKPRERKPKKPTF